MVALLGSVYINIRVRKTNVNKEHDEKENKYNCVEDMCMFACKDIEHAVVRAPSARGIQY